MENKLQVFTNEQFGQIRTISQNGGPWFVAADVCRALELGDTHKAVERLDSDEKGRNSIPTLGGMQEMTVVNEPGLYALVLGSRKPEAKAFKRWITHEVIPAIRMHGMYATAETAERILQDPDFLIKTLQEHKIRRQKIGKALHVTDETYLREAQRLLFDELAGPLGLMPAQVHDYLTEKFAGIS
jgi:prophage antirepressor-like protein